MSKWTNSSNLTPKQFLCGHCGNQTGSAEGFKQNLNNPIFIYICQFCSKPSIFQYNGATIPGNLLGSEIKTKEINNCIKLYNEARRCYSVNSYTAVVTCCRIILMHLAVSKGAKENQSFQQYITYLVDENYVPVTCRDWVDSIRKIGNEANHEIVVVEKEHAKAVIKFTEMLLKFFFEYPEVALDLQN